MNLNPKPLEPGSIGLGLGLNLNSIKKIKYIKKIKIYCECKKRNGLSWAKRIGRNKLGEMVGLDMLGLMAARWDQPNSMSWAQ